MPRWRGHACLHGSLAPSADPSGANAMEQTYSHGFTLSGLLAVTGLVLLLMAIAISLGPTSNGHLAIGALYGAGAAVAILWATPRIIRHHARPH